MSVQPYRRSHQQAFAGFESHGAFAGDAVHFEQTAMRRMAMVQTGMDDNDVETSVVVAEIFSVLPVVRHVGGNIREREVGETNLAENAFIQRASANTRMLSARDIVPLAISRLSTSA